MTSTLGGLAEMVVHSNDCIVQQVILHFRRAQSDPRSVEVVQPKRLRNPRAELFASLCDRTRHTSRRMTTLTIRRCFTAVAFSFRARHSKAGYSSSVKLASSCMRYTESACRSIQRLPRSAAMRTFRVGNQAYCCLPFATSLKRAYALLHLSFQYTLQHL